MEVVYHFVPRHRDVRLFRMPHRIAGVHPTTILNLSGCSPNASKLEIPVIVRLTTQ